VPNPTVVAVGGSVCAGSNFSVNPSGGVIYTLLPATTVSTNFVFSPSSSGTYTIVGDDANGCSDSVSVFISVVQNSLSSFNITGATSICKGDVIPYQVSGASSYTWSNGSNSATQMLSPQSSTVISVTGSDQNNCTKTLQIAVQVNACLGITKIINENRFQIAPNPAHGIFEISSELAGALIIVDATGKECFKKWVDRGRTEIQIDNLPPGIYQLIIEGEHTKLIIE
jgi:hypothetical protein